MKRGTVIWVNLESETPPEFGKTRPAVVLSNSYQNELLKTLVIVPVSSRGKEIWPLRIEFSLPNLKKSFIVVPSIRQVNKQRLGETIGLLSYKDLSSLEEAVNAYLKD